MLRVALLISLSFFASIAWATPDYSPIQSDDDSGFETHELELFTEPAASYLLDPSEAFLRTQAVLEHFGVPPESDFQRSFDDLQRKTSADQIRGVLKFLDLSRVSQDYLRITPGGAASDFRMFQDFKSARILDYQVELAPNGKTPAPSGEFHERLLHASSRNSANRPLAGLKIALDPGHMGGDSWDQRTGKFVRDKQGRKLSEGVLALQIAILLQEDLKKLGADVLITRNGLNASSSLPYESFPLHEFALRELRHTSLESWFQNLLSSGKPGPSLYSAFSASPSFKKLFSESMRSKYFILREDLDARVRSIESFRPDMTLVIHLDASKTVVGAKPRNGTKVYVPGAFMTNELVGREERRSFGRHLLDTTAWNASVALSRNIVRNISSTMGIPFDSENPQNSIQIEPGVQARNLGVTRKLSRQATAYLECMFYDDPREFPRLIQADHAMTIDGRSYPYSNRLRQLSGAIRDGVVSFVRGYR